MSIYGPKELSNSFRTVRKNTIQIAEEIPEDQYGFQSAPNVRSVARLLTHIAVAPRIWRAIHESGVTDLNGFDFMGLFGPLMAEEATPRTKGEIVALLTSEGESFASFLAGLTDEFLAVEIEQPGGQGKKVRLEMLMGAKEHEMHHRGQMMLIQRQLGIVPHLTRAMEARMAQMMAAKAGN